MMSEINIKEFKRKHGIKNMIQIHDANRIVCIDKSVYDRVGYATSVAYVYFCENNWGNLQQIKKNPDFFGSWDCSGITKSDRKFVVEFKVRNLNAGDYSNKTMIETSKLKALRKFSQQHPEFTIKYICYFNDCGLSFNLSQRFRNQGNSDILASYDIPCKRSYYNTAMQFNTVKKVNFLAFNAKMWGDKIIVYG